jgi:hypothetical protein
MWVADGPGYPAVSHGKGNTPDWMGGSRVVPTAVHFTGDLDDRSRTGALRSDAFRLSPCPGKPN